MNAILYKLKQLLKCKQSYYHNCLSNNGPFSLIKVENSINYICDPVYDVMQKSVVEKCQKIQINSITSWNIQELFWHCYNGEKINNILNYILSSQSDIICIQEAFEIPTLDAIIFNESIKCKYPYFLTGSLANRFIIGENSGLIVLLNRILSDSLFTDKTFLIGDLNLKFPQIFTSTSVNNTKITHKDTNEILDHIINTTRDIDFTVEVDDFNINQYSDHYPLIAFLIKY